MTEEIDLNLSELAYEILDTLPDGSFDAHWFPGKAAKPSNDCLPTNDDYPFPSHFLSDAQILTVSRPSDHRPTMMGIPKCKRQPHDMTPIALVGYCVEWEDTVKVAFDPRSTFLEVLAILSSLRKATDSFTIENVFEHRIDYRHKIARHYYFLGGDEYSHPEYKELRDWLNGTFSLSEDFPFSVYQTFELMDSDINRL